VDCRTEQEPGVGAFAHNTPDVEVTNPRCNLFRDPSGHDAKANRGLKRANKPGKRVRLDERGSKEGL
jgi:hypothetical protein